MGRRVEAKELLARQQTEAALLHRRVQLIYFRQSTAAKYLISICVGIVAAQNYCLACEND
jgi:hypothetical protein|tara:strand:+ start:125 stop:304 length:180 start_codon:yes stop_codon:yes gene_type:complete